MWAMCMSVEHRNKLVRYASNEGNPLEQQLWQVNFAGERKQVTRGAGTHEGNFAPAGGGFVDKQSALMEPPSVWLCQPAEREANKCNEFWSTRALEPYHLSPPVQLEVKAHDGTTLYATLLLPEGATSPASVPLIVNPYGGPGPQIVANAGATRCSSTSCWPSTDSPFCTPTIVAPACAGATLRRRRITTSGQSNSKTS